MRCCTAATWKALQRVPRASLRSPRFSLASASVSSVASRACFSTTRIACKPTATAPANTINSADGNWEAPPTTVTAERLASVTPMVLLQTALRQYAALEGTLFAETYAKDENHTVISRQKFNELCEQSHVADSGVALQLLDAAAVVVALDEGQRVHLRPAQYADELDVVQALQSQQGEGGVPSLSDFELPVGFLEKDAEDRIKALEQKEEEMRVKLQPAIARAARWRRSVWGGALLYAGAQLAVIARLTYFDLDWDIMEPVSYCLGIGTTLLFYFYFLRYDVEHTYTDFDKRYLPRRVYKYAPADFDWAAYNGLCRQLADQRAMLEHLRKFSRSA